MAVAHSRFLRKKKILDFLILILKTWTFARAWNFILLKFSYFLSLALKRPVLLGTLPASVGIEPTTACNLRCPQCVSGLKAFTRPTGNLKPENFRKILQNIPRKTWSILFFFQGEPYINPHFTNFVALAKKRKFFTIASTNAHFLSEENARKTVEAGLDYLIISLDGTSQEIYEHYRRKGNLTKVLNGIRNLIQARGNKKNPIIELQFIVFKHNEHQVQDFLKLARTLGVDKISVKSAQIYYDFEQWLPEKSPLKRYKKNGEEWQLKNGVPNKCWKMWHSCEITWDGNVLPCCFDKNAEFIMGNLRNEPLRKVWKKTKYRQMRKQILANRSGIPMCNNCTEGVKI